MSEQAPGPEQTVADLGEIQRGLRMEKPIDQAALQAEREFLQGLESAGSGERMKGYLGLQGPGFLQSAMTLGGGTAASALFAGAIFGYKLLWVAPVAMLLGVIMLSAISYQTLSTGLRPFEAMKRYAGAPLAWAWAFGALIASIIWHFPQYSLASAALVDMGEVLGMPGLNAAAMAPFVLVWAIAISLLYSASPRAVRIYERVLKYVVWLIILCFGLVVLRTGISDWGALLKGFFAFEIPREKNGILGVTLVLSGLSAAVGINMVFLYPYSLLARGWQREHRRLARFDLWFGMFLPYVLATSLMVIATANTLNLDPLYEGRRLAPIEAAQSLAAVVGPTMGRVVFNFGILAMALSTITLHMITAGFVCSEVMGWKFGSLKYRLATLLPIPGVLGPLFWSDIAVWIAVPTNIICGLFLPAAYVGFLVLQRKRAYLGQDTPEGPRATLWFYAMLATTLFLSLFFAWYLVNNAPAWLERVGI